MLDWLSFHLGEIIGLIHVLEKSLYQNKTLLCYYFGSVYDPVLYSRHMLQKHIVIQTLDKHI